MVVPRNMPIQRIIEVVSVVMGVPIDQIAGGGRKRRNARAKQAVSLLAEEAGRSSKQTAVALHLNDHSTILYHRAQGRNILPREADFARTVATARWVLESIDPHRRVPVPEPVRVEIRVVAARLARKTRQARELETRLAEQARTIAWLNEERQVRERNMLAHDDSGAVERMRASDILGAAIAASGGSFR